MEHINDFRSSLTSPATAIALCAGLAGGIWGSMVYAHYRKPPPAPQMCASVPVAPGVNHDAHGPYGHPGFHPRFYPAYSSALPPVSEPVTRACPDEPPPGIRRTGTHYQIRRAALDRVLADPSALPESARFVPSLGNGKPNGFKVYAVRPCGIMDFLGLQNGDRIESLNGMDLSTPDHALLAYQKLHRAGHLDLLLERHGVNLHLDYQID